MAALFRGRGGGGISWLIVCLGNPGPRYTSTRHNAGFLAADAFCEQKGIRCDRLRFRALTGRWDCEEGSVLVMKPQTFMNNSGESVGEAARFFKLPADHVLVLSDEMALPPGRIRVRAGGSAGGHNGLKSIISHLGTDRFPRIRIGVGQPPAPGPDQVDWVLGVPRNEDWTAFSDACRRAAEAAGDYILLGADKTMSKYN